MTNDRKLYKPGDRYHGMTRAEAFDEAMRDYKWIGSYTQQWEWSDSAEKFIETSAYLATCEKARNEVARAFGD
jgi:hypothetical protein